MTAMSNATEEDFLNWLLGKADMPATTTRYLALFTAYSADGDTVTEVSGGSYARVNLTAAIGTNTGGDSEATSSDILFPEATADWGTIVAWGIYDALTVGELKAGELLSGGDVTINTGDQFKFSTGNLLFNVA